MKPKQRQPGLMKKTTAASSPWNQEEIFLLFLHGSAHSARSFSISFSFSFSYFFFFFFSYPFSSSSIYPILSRLFQSHLYSHIISTCVPFSSLTYHSTVLYCALCATRFILQTSAAVCLVGSLCSITYPPIHSSLYSVPYIAPLP